MHKQNLCMLSMKIQQNNQTNEKRPNGWSHNLVKSSENVQNKVENKMSLDTTWRSSRGSRPITAQLLEPDWNMRFCDWPNSNSGGSSSADSRFG